MKSSRFLIVGLALALLLTACATAHRFTDAPYASYDTDTEYAISDASDGFTVFVYYSIYQYFPNEDVVQQSAKQNAMAIAYEYADRSNREIEPINEQRIRIAAGRNFLGITSASVAVRVFYR